MSHERPILKRNIFCLKKHHLFLSKIFLSFLLLAMVLVSSPRALALEVESKIDDLGPMMGRVIIFYLRGEIGSGDVALLKSKIAEAGVTSKSAISFLFDSPGGIVTEAMKIGVVIDSLPHGVITRVGRKATEVEEEVNDVPARCASACVLAFLGGHYRYAEDGELGVHQFFYGGDGRLSGTQASSTAQVLSAEIVKYIRHMRADPELFSLITQAFSNEIYWLSKVESERLRVVTGDVYDENSEYLNSAGNFYLRLWQQGRTGESKLVVWCEKSGPMFIAYLQPPEFYMNGHFVLMIDGEVNEPKQMKVVSDPNTDGGRWVEVMFQATETQVYQLAHASSVGARMVFPSGEMFFGFEKQIRDNKFREMVEGCEGK